MKNRSKISELGSMMVEALAMLALIAMVTPILYKKSAERTTELQDINAAGELRAIIKAVDDYISANYDAIIAGESVNNTCSGSYNSQSYSEFQNATDANLEVPIGHFCEFLPYGILDDDGEAKKSRLFSENYNIILKLKGNNEEHGDKVVTAFVVTDPNAENGLETVRAASIASMIGGNGGFVTETSGEGDNASGKISGNLGIWGIEDTRDELGIGVKKGAVVAASIQGISAQNAKIDIDGVLYREEKSDADLNTMSTTLYMGAKDALHDGNNIVNIGQLIAGAQEAPNESDRLYIKKGDIRLGENGNETDETNIYIDGAGDITLADGGIGVTGGDIDIKFKEGAIPEGGGEAPQEGGNLHVDGAITAALDAFTVATDGAVKALSYIAGEGEEDAVKIHIAKTEGEDDYRTTINEPLEVYVDESCTYIPSSTEGADGPSEGDCALYVKGDAVIEGDLSIRDAFSSQDLHARRNLTVGGSDVGTGKALEIKYTGPTEGAEGTGTSIFDFGSGLLNIEQTGDKQGSLDFADSFVEIEKLPGGEGGELKEFLVNEATDIEMTTTTGAFKMNDNYIGIGSSGNSLTDYAMIYMSGKGDDTYALDEGSLSMQASQFITMNDEAFKIMHTSAAPSGGGITPESNEISSKVKSFTIKPTDIADGTDSYFQVSENIDGESADKGQVLMKGIKTYMLDTAQYLRNSTFHVQSSTTTEESTSHSDVVRIGESSSDESQIDISGEKIVAHEEGGTTQKVLKIEFSAGATGEGGATTYDDEEYPIYVRRGAIELKEVESGKTGYDKNTYHNYIQADRFISNHEMETDALIDHDGNTLTTDMNYEINPAYTSIMHDIKLTTRGGARLSDILPDFINKGIYIVDNTYPAKGESCSGAGMSLNSYKAKSRSDKQSVNSCTSITEEVSPWAGFVPTPTCPPGYSKVITLTPASFAMAQAGIPYAKDSWYAGADISVPYIVKSPYDYLDESTITDAPPTPLYYQKNTWLKSFVEKYTASSGEFEGWDVGMGFIYPYNLYSSYIDEVGNKDSFDNAGFESNDTCIIWNMFPVYAGTLEGYATVYCYFNRGGGLFNDTLVDTEYDQLGNFRTSKSKTNADYNSRLNDDRNPGGESVW